MPKFQSKTANDALAALDRLDVVEDEPRLVVDIAALCKNAAASDAQTACLIKFAREFVQLSGLCTEDLVKRALTRFLQGRNTDSILRGVKSVGLGI